MASIYDLNYYTFTDNLLPPAERLPAYIAYMNSMAASMQWDHDNFFINYVEGSAYPLWTSATSYTQNDRVIAWYPFDTYVDYLTSNFSQFSPHSSYVVGDLVTWFADNPPAFDPTAAYVIGQLVIESDAVYEAISNNGPGAFNPADWQTVNGVLLYKAVSNNGPSSPAGFNPTDWELIDSYSFGNPLSNAVYECEVDKTILLHASSGSWPVLCAPTEDQGTGANLISYINGGSVTGIGIQNGGAGYGQAAWVNILGGAGSGAVAVLNYDNNAVTAGLVTLSAGAITGLKLLDTNNFPLFDPLLSYTTGLHVTYNYVAYTANTNTGPGTFVPGDWNIVGPSNSQPTQYVVPPTIMFIDSTGAGAKVIAEMNNGIVTGFSVATGGSGYTAPQVIIFGGTTRRSGTITNVTMVQNGSGYTQAPQVILGSQWSLVANDFRGSDFRAIYDAQLGTLTWVLNEWFHTTFRNFNPIGGIGLYGWGTGNSATATATELAGAIDTMTITTPGSGYATAPIVFISDPSSSATGAVVQAVMNNGSVIGFDIISGGTGYTAPVVNLFGGGTGQYQQAHSDIFISTLNQSIGDIFYVGNIETQSSYVVNIESDVSVPFLAYIQGDNGNDVTDYIIWIPLTLWNKFIALNYNPVSVVKSLADKYSLAGITYAVLPY